MRQEPVRELFAGRQPVAAAEAPWTDRSWKANPSAHQVVVIAEFGPLANLAHLLVLALQAQEEMVRGEAPAVARRVKSGGNGDVADVAAREAETLREEFE